VGIVPRNVLGELIAQLTAARLRLGNSIMSQVAQHIKRSTRALISHQALSEKLRATPFESKDILLLNNSFVFREKQSIKTTKSDQYVCVHVTKGGNFSRAPRVATGIAINSDFKRITSGETSKLNLVTLERALASQLNSLGNLVFILIGHIDDTLVIRQPIHHSEFNELVWNPGAKDPMSVLAPLITVADTGDEAQVWSRIADHFSDSGSEVPEGLRDAFAVAIDKLKDQALANLVLPSSGVVHSPNMTESIVQVLEEQRDEYKDALKQSRKQAAVSNDVLRIAYNFASDAITFIRLIISICDLKPVVLWGTIDKHFALAEALRNLPWHRHRNKPSLRNYRTTIADARNSAFHNLFPFRKSLDVALPEDSLQEARMRIFSEHGKKSQNQLLYQDKELVDLLFEFTRARERQVSLQFWESNLSVMDATIDLCEGTASFVKALLLEGSK